MSTADAIGNQTTPRVVAAPIASLIDDLVASHESREAIPRIEVTTVLPMHMKVTARPVAGPAAERDGTGGALEPVMSSVDSMWGARSETKKKAPRRRS